MKLEVGMCVRTKNGAITKIEQIVDDEIHFNIKPIFSDGEQFGYNWVYIKDVIKSSHNIIDLIEVGDYVNGLLVARICEDNETKKKFINLYGSVSEWEEEDIKSIVTKEQFEQMQYKVGE